MSLLNAVENGLSTVKTSNAFVRQSLYVICNFLEANADQLLLNARHMHLLLSSQDVQ